MQYFHLFCCAANRACVPGLLKTGFMKPHVHSFFLSKTHRVSQTEHWVSHAGPARYLFQISLNISLYPSPSLTPAPSLLVVFSLSLSLSLTFSLPLPYLSHNGSLASASVIRYCNSTPLSFVLSVSLYCVIQLSYAAKLHNSE